MGKLQNLQIALANNTESFYPGHTVAGSVKFTTSKSISISVIHITLYGSCKTKWHVGSGDDEKTYKGKEQYCALQSVLWGGVTSNQHTLLQPGNHEKQFSVTLPGNCPSTFNGTRGNVFYEICVICKFPGIMSSDESCTRPINVYDPVNLSADVRTASLLYEPMQFREEVDDGCCFVKQVIKVLLTTDKSAYAPGDKVFLNGSIENGCDDRLKFNLALVQHVRYFGTRSDFSLTSSGNLKHRDKTQCAMDWSGPDIPGRTRKDFQNFESMCIPMVVATGLRNCRLIDVNYSLQVSVLAPGACGGLYKFKPGTVVIGWRESDSRTAPSAPPAVDLELQPNFPPAYASLPPSAPPADKTNYNANESLPPPPSYASAVKSTDVTGAGDSSTTYYDWSQSAFTYN